MLRNLDAWRLLGALVLLLVSWANGTVPNGHLPASFVGTVDLLEATDLPDVERQVHVSNKQHQDEHYLRVSFGGDEGPMQQHLLFYLRGTLQQRQHSADGLLPSSQDPTDHYYTAWLVHPADDDNQSGLNSGFPPGLVSLCNGTVNGSLPINGTHIGRVEPLADQTTTTTGVAGSKQCRISVHRFHRTREDAAEADEVDEANEVDEADEANEADDGNGTHSNDTVPFEPIVWPTQQTLRRVRRQFSRRARYHKYRPERRLQFQRVNVTFNLQHKFLTKFGPYVIQLHLYLDPELRSKMKDSQDKMVAKAKEVVNFANTLLRPFNTYILVSSLHLPFGNLYVKPSFSHDPLNFMQKEYVRGIYSAMNDEVIDCVFTFL